jgi:hypothetical protein
MLAAWFIVQICFDAVRPYSWPRVTGVILANEGKLDPNANEFMPPFAWRTRYRYEVQGQTFEGEEAGVTRDWLGITARQKRYPVGGQAVIFADPAEPKKSFLERPSLWVLLLLLFPLPFLSVPAFMGFAARRAARTPDRTAPDQALDGRWMILVHGVLILTGGGIFFGFLSGSSWQAIRARTWSQTEGTVEFSRVGKYRSSKGGPTYSIDVLFSYRAAGALYRSSRYELIDVSSSGAEAKEAVVERLKPGVKITCYYDPSHPERAVIDREFPPLLLLGLIPLFLFVTGVIGLLRRFLRRVRPEPEEPPQVAATDGPLLLRSPTTRLARFLGCFSIALLWNVVVAVLGVYTVRAWYRGQFDLVQTVIALLFAAVGAVAALCAFHFFMGLFILQDRLGDEGTRRGPLLGRR